jgi:tetratricopeptide (TPR) repeat protein
MGVNAQDWARTYQDAVNAFRAGDDAAAAGGFQAALSTPNIPTARGRNVLYRSQIRGEFMPEYYLAVIYSRQGRHQEALRYANDALRYIGQGDPFFASLAAARDASQRALNPPASTTSIPQPTSTPTTAPATSSTVPASTSSVPAEEPSSTTTSVDPSLGRFEQLMAEAGRHRAAGNYAAARRSANQAGGLDVDDARVTTFLGELAAIESAARTRSFERTGLRAFYQGDYAGALAVLEQAPAAQQTPRMLFYMACSHVALAITTGDADGRRRQAARDLLARSRPGQNALALDRQYISPRVLDVLEGRAPLT